VIATTATSARADERPARSVRPATTASSEQPARAPAPRDAAASWEASLTARVGAAPPPVINIYNQWTREYLPVVGSGPTALPPALVNRFFRCRFTGQRTHMDPRLLPLLVDAARHFGADKVRIVSAYRSPKYNLILQKKGRNVSRRSQHMAGKAVDFWIPGVPLRRLRQWARARRLGGVGYYTVSRFIHADTARVRTWTAR